MKIYSFDIDETLEVSAGPVKISSLVELKQQGHCIGLCGNWARFVQVVPWWHNLISFMNAGAPTKEELLTQIKMYVPAEEYVMVGNILSVSGASDDEGAAKRAGWRFIRESDFANGIR